MRRGGAITGGPRWRAVALGVALVASPPAQAQDPGAAEIAFTDHTLFLATELAAQGPAMVVWTDTGLNVTFAQLHLSFPLPPLLQVDLRRDGDAWQLQNLHLDQLGLTDDYHARLGDLTLTTLSASPEWLRLRSEGALTPDTLAAPQPARIDLHIPLPPR